MIGLAQRLVRLLCDPACSEEIAGDLTELTRKRTSRAGQRHARIRLVIDVLSVCVHQSRIRTIDSRVIAIGIASVALLMIVPHTRAPYPTLFNVNATDPAGEFTLRVESGRVVSATMDGIPVEAERLRQRGNQLVIVGGDGNRDLVIHVRAGGIQWKPRQPRTLVRSAPDARLPSPVSQ